MGFPLAGKGYELLGVVSQSMSIVAQPEKANVPTAVILAGAGAGIAGFSLIKEHRVLGFLAGDSIGMNAFRIYRGEGDDRKLAACNLATMACLVVGSLAVPKHPFWGGLAGFAVGVAATALVPGSNSNKLFSGSENERLKQIFPPSEEDMSWEEAWTGFLVP